MDYILKIILENTYTKSQLKHRLYILKSYLLQKFFGGPAKITEEDLSYLKTLPSALFQNFNKSNIYTAFNTLEAQLDKLPSLILYISFESSDQTTSSIAAFARKAFNSSLLLDIKFDPGLIAGVALVWKGVYKDYSLRAKIAEKTTEVSDVFKKFLR